MLASNSPDYWNPNYMEKITLIIVQKLVEVDVVDYTEKLKR